MGWLIDLEEELIFVYFADRTITLYEQPGAIVLFRAFAELLSLTVGQMFSWLSQ